MESKTPRTDSESRLVNHTTYYMGAAFSAKIEVVDADVARRLETELAEAKALIECMQAAHADAMDRARAEIDRLNKERMCDALDGQSELDELHNEIKRKDRLIEQMYEAIKFSLIADKVRQTRNVCASDINDACETSRIKRIAALSAAERGE